MFLNLQNEITYRYIIKFGIILKLVLSSNTSETEIWHKMRTVVVVMKDIWGETSKMEPEN